MRRILSSRHLVLMIVSVAALAAIGSIKSNDTPAEASHPFNYSYGNRAVGVNWLFGCVCWNNDVIDWLNGFASPGLEIQVRNSAFYPQNSWPSASYPYVWVVRDAPGTGNEVLNFIVSPPPSCDGVWEPCETHIHLFTNYNGNFLETNGADWVDRGQIHFYQTSRNRCAGSYTPGTQAYYDCIATTISHETGHALFLNDHKAGEPGYDDPTIMHTPPRSRQFPTDTDKRVAGQCVYLHNC
jgi:hypothetical protein